MSISVILYSTHYNKDTVEFLNNNPEFLLGFLGILIAIWLSYWIYKLLRHIKK